MNEFSFWKILVLACFADGMCYEKDELPKAPPPYVKLEDCLAAARALPPPAKDSRAYDNPLVTGARYGCVLAGWKGTHP